MTDALHRLRRWLWRLRNPMLRVQLLRERGRCLNCGANLTTDEIHYYDYNCERCEGIAFHEEQAALGVDSVDGGRRP